MQKKKKAVAKKEDAKRKNSATTKKTTIQASSANDLLRKIKEIDWSGIRESRNSESNRFDVSI